MTDPTGAEQIRPITQQDLETTVRVLTDLDRFQQAMNKTGGLRGGLYFSSDYKSSLQPAAETVQTFGTWLLAFK